MALKLLALLMVLIARGSCQNGLNVPAMLVFGDSTMDVGNNNFLLTLVRSDHAPYGRIFPDRKSTGRFTDGKLSIDYIAEKLNLSYPLPYLDSRAKGKNLLNGINFASAGSGLLDSTTNILNVIKFREQLTWFDKYKDQLVKLVGKRRSALIISKALYVVGTANNDYIYYKQNSAVYPKYNTAQFTSLLIQNMSTYLEQIYAKGGRKIGVLSVGPLGCLPAEKSAANRPLDPKCLDDVNGVVESYNSQLQDLLQTLTSKLSGSKFVYLDSYSILLDATLNPAKYGFKISNKSCCGTGLTESGLTCNFLSLGTCNDSSSYVFFDSYHPTTAMDKIIANKFYTEAKSKFLG